MPPAIDALDRLHRFVERYKTQTDAAKALGITQAYLSDLINMRRDITNAPSVLAGLGLKRVVVQKEKP